MITETKIMSEDGNQRCFCNLELLRIQGTTILVCIKSPDSDDNFFLHQKKFHWNCIHEAIPMKMNTCKVCFGAKINLKMTWYTVVAFFFFFIRHNISDFLLLSCTQNSFWKGSTLKGKNLLTRSTLQGKNSEKGSTGILGGKNLLLRSTLREKNYERIL